MTLTETELTINLDDKVSFNHPVEGDAVLTGTVFRLLSYDELIVLVAVNEFLMCELPVSEIRRVNNVIIASPKFKNQYTVRVGV